MSASAIKTSFFDYFSEIFLLLTASYCSSGPKSMKVNSKMFFKLQYVRRPRTSQNSKRETTKN